MGCLQKENNGVIQIMRTEICVNSKNFIRRIKSFKKRIKVERFHDRLMHIARITHYLESIFTEPINYSILFICSGKEGNRIKRNNKMWFIGEISCWARSEIFLRTLVDSIKKDKRIITFTYSEEAYDMLLKDPFNYSKTSIECQYQQQS